MPRRRVEMMTEILQLRCKPLSKRKLKVYDKSLSLNKKRKIKVSRINLNAKKTSEHFWVPKILTKNQPRILWWTWPINISKWNNISKRRFFSSPVKSSHKKPKWLTWKSKLIRKIKKRKKWFKKMTKALRNSTRELKKWAVISQTCLRTLFPKCKTELNLLTAKIGKKMEIIKSSNSLIT